LKYNLSVSNGALAIFSEMVKYGFEVCGSRSSQGVFGVVPGPHAMPRVSGIVSSDLPRAEFCIELIDAGLCEPTPSVSVNANGCYRISEAGYDLAKRPRII
jgi:hypothetical protein